MKHLYVTSTHQSGRLTSKVYLAKTIKEVVNLWLLDSGLDKASKVSSQITLNIFPQTETLIIASGLTGSSAQMEVSINPAIQI